MFGVIVELKKNYKVVTVIICVSSSVMSVVMMAAMNSGNPTLTSIACFFTGFSMIAILPVGSDFGVELTHPTPEPVSSGLLMCSGSIFGIFQTIFASESINLFEGRPNLGCFVAQSLLIVSGFIASVCAYFIKEDLRRIKEAKEKEEALSFQEVGGPDE